MTRFELNCSGKLTHTWRTKGSATENMQPKSTDTCLSMCERLCLCVCVCAVAGTHVLLVKLFVALNVCVPTLSDVVAVFLTTCFQNHMNRILDIRRLPWLIIKHTNGQVNQFQFGDHSFIHSFVQNVFRLYLFA